MLKPHIDLIVDDEHWRGDIGANFTESQWVDWFQSYGKMLSHYAVLADSWGVEMLSVSCELIAVSSQDAHWRQLVPILRSFYKGKLVSSANWGHLDSRGGQETNKTWTDTMDYIGVDAYYPIANDV